MIYIFRNTDDGTFYTVAVDARWDPDLDRDAADRLMRDLGADTWEAFPGAVASSLHEVLIDWSPRPSWLKHETIARSTLDKP